MPGADCPDQSSEESSQPLSGTPPATADHRLETALATYPGALLLVTHDRRTLEAVKTTHRIEVADGHVTSR